MPLHRTSASDAAKINWVYAIMGWGGGAVAVPEVNTRITEDGQLRYTEDDQERYVE